MYRCFPICLILALLKFLREHIKAARRVCAEAFEGHFQGDPQGLGGWGLGFVSEVDKCFIGIGQQGKINFPGCRSGWEGWKRIWSIAGHRKLKRERMMQSYWGGTAEMRTRKNETKESGKARIVAAVTSILWKRRWMKMMNVRTNTSGNIDTGQKKVPLCSESQDAFCSYIWDVSTVIGIIWWNDKRVVGDRSTSSTKLTADWF